MENGCLLLDVTPHGVHYVEVKKLLLRRFLFIERRKK